MRPRARCFLYHAATDSVLLITRFKDGQHYWTVPGGAVLTDETAAETVQRELLAELRLHLTPGQLRLLAETVRHGDPETYFVAELAMDQPLTIHSVELNQERANNWYQPQWVSRDSLVTKLPYLNAIARLATAQLAERIPAGAL